MKSFALLAIIVLRPLAIGLATLAKVIVVFHWTTLRDVAASIAEEARAAMDAEPDDWGR